MSTSVPVAPCEITLGSRDHAHAVGARQLIGINSVIDQPGLG